MSTTKQSRLTHNPYHIDLREYDPSIHSQLILSRFELLAPSAHLEIVSDTPPTIALQQLKAQWASSYQLEDLPVDAKTPYRVRITRSGQAKTCCGGCGGGH